MIGKIFMGSSFRGCISYCLKDKLDPLSGEVAFRNRAEVLYTNYCCGGKQDLIDQFSEVRALNRRVEKPVMHIALSLAPGEVLERGKLAEMVYDVAREMNFERNQYVAVSHVDTGHQHVHIVVNRVGYDGKTLKDNHNWGKMAACCRKMELKYDLQQVLSPGRYLSKEQRLLPRQDTRKDTLRQHLQQALSTAKTYEDFHQKLRAQGYQILKGRGVSFIDDKGVKIKGSEVGYSLMRIERTLAQKAGGQQLPEIAKERGTDGPFRAAISKGQESDRGQDAVPHPQKENALEKVAELLLKPEQNWEGINPNFQINKKDKKRKKKSLHL